MTRRLPLVLWLLTLGMIATWFVLYLAGEREQIYAYWGEEVAIGIAFSTLGFLVLRHDRANRLAWIFLALGALVPSGLVAGQAAIASGVGLLGALSEAIRLGGLVGLGYLLLLYPTGHLLSRRWIWVGVLLAVSTSLNATGSALGPVEGVPDIASATRSFAPVIGAAVLVGGLLMLVAFLAAVISLIVRFRRSRGIERLQMKLFVYSCIAIALVLVLTNVFLGRAMEGALGSIVWGSPGIVLPAAAFFAILKHGLYDIDRIVSRTVSYALITAVLVGLYAVVAVGVPAVFLGGRSSELSIALATLAAAAAFGPVRRAIQTRIDRRFNRARYDGERITLAFASRLREQIDLDVLLKELQSVAARAVHPEHVSVWIPPTARR